MSNASIVEFAAKSAGYFETRSRDNGEKFVARKDSSPDWLADLCHHCHGDMMPDDHRYQMIVDCLWAIAEHDGDFDSARDALGPPIYTSELTEWLNSRTDRYSYVEQAIEEFGQTSEGFLGQLSVGYLAELWETFSLVVEWVEDNWPDCLE